MSTKGKQTKAQKAARMAELERKKRIKREATGVLLIALGLFFAASLYVDAVGILGRVVSRVCFGLFGVLSYVLPLIMLALGVLSISASSGKGAAFSTFVLSILALLCILVLLHANARSAVESISLLDYYVDAYQFGSNLQKGGGVIGALLAYHVHCPIAYPFVDRYADIPSLCRYSNRQANQDGRQRGSGKNRRRKENAI